MPKSREMAGSWTVIITQAHDWNFNNGSHLILSRKFEEVDQMGNPDTPFEKLRFFLKRIPEWQLPKGFDWKKHSHVARLENPNGGHIGGDAMTGNAGAGGRVKSILFDESAKVKDGKDFHAWTSCSLTANLKFSVSTPEGQQTKLTRLVENSDKENAKVIWMFWWKDPRKMHNPRFENGKLTSDWNEEMLRTLDEVTYASQVAISFADSVKGAIYASYYKSVHQNNELEVEPGVPVIRQQDPGPHWFTLWTQILPCGCYYCHREEYFEMKGIKHIGEKITEISNNEFEYCEFDDVGDPAGSHKKSVITTVGDELKSEYMALQEITGIAVKYGFMYKIPKDEWITRGILSCVSRMTGFCLVHERPYLQVNVNKCPILHQALSGKYAYKTNHDGTPTGVINEFHPIEDAADAFKYGPLSRGMYITKNRDKPRPRRTNNGEWMSPADM